MLCTAQGEIPSAQAEELFGKVLKVLDNHKSGWARAVGRLEEGLRRAGVALGECFRRVILAAGGYCVVRGAEPGCTPCLSGPCQ